MSATDNQRLAPNRPHSLSLVQDETVTCGPLELALTGEVAVSVVSSTECGVVGSGTLILRVKSPDGSHAILLDEALARAIKGRSCCDCDCGRPRLVACGEEQMRWLRVVALELEHSGAAQEKLRPIACAQLALSVALPSRLVRLEDHHVSCSETRCVRLGLHGSLNYDECEGATRFMGSDNEGLFEATLSADPQRALGPLPSVWHARVDLLRMGDGVEGHVSLSLRRGEEGVCGDYRCEIAEVELPDGVSCRGTGLFENANGFFLTGVVCVLRLTRLGSAEAEAAAMEALLG